MIRRMLDAVLGVSFHRGLALGAMVGAAIAGSTLWSRLRIAREARRRSSDGASVSDPDGTT